LGTDRPGALPHSEKTTVRRLLETEELRIDAGAVVADGYAQLRTRILNFCFDDCRARMTQSVKQSFATNQVELLLDFRIHSLGAAFNKDSKLSAAALHQFFA